MKHHLQVEQLHDRCTPSTLRVSTGVTVDQPATQTGAHVDGMTVPTPTGGSVEFDGLDVTGPTTPAIHQEVNPSVSI